MIPCHSLWQRGPGRQPVLSFVLYELSTGKRAFEANTLAELTRMHEHTSLTSPSTLVDGFDPAVERVILCCLDKTPADRPGSALAVAAALNGGDPLVAALAAGETPSPELVALAGEKAGLKPWIAWTCLVLIAVGLPAARCWASTRSKIDDEIHFLHSRFVEIQEHWR